MQKHGPRAAVRAPARLRRATLPPLEIFPNPKGMVQRHGPHMQRCAHLHALAYASITHKVLILGTFVPISPSVLECPRLAARL